MPSPERRQKRGTLVIGRRTFVPAVILVLGLGPHPCKAEHVILLLQAYGV
jgi:hypothetical protein